MMNSLFEPKSVAIIGASGKKEKIGYQIVEGIIDGGFKGKIYPVNPKGGTVLGKKIFGSIEDVPEKVDMAVVVIPAAAVVEEAGKCASAGVRNLVVITSGFSEVGNSEAEKEIVSIAKKSGMRVLGPNIFGIYSSQVNLNATFGPRGIKAGNVAIITQSGAIGIAMIGKTKTENIGLSAIVSIGNKADITEADLLEYLVTHDRTKIILMYIEGVSGGERLVAALKEATRKKPVVVIKSGRSKRGAMAAASHTGSLAGADDVFDDIMHQCGVIRAESIKEAMDWCRFFEDAPMPKGEKSVIITNGGGIGVLAADACEKYGVTLLDNPKLLKEEFAPVMPAFGSARNPVDITGEASAEDYSKALTVGLDVADMDSVICLGCETASFNAESFAKIVRKQYENYKSSKPIVFSVFGGEAVEKNIQILKKEGMPIFSDVYEAVSCMGALYKHYRNLRSPLLPPEKARIDTELIRNTVAKVKAAGRNFLLANEAREVMKAAGVDLPESRIVRNIGEAVKCAEEIGYPVVMKIVSKDIIHKSDAGGVVLDLDDSGDVADAYESIMQNCKRYKRDAVIEGVEVAEMIKPGIETIIGARRDAAFGPVVMFGLGGVYVEVMKDVSFRAFPVSKAESLGMISAIRAYPLLLGVRGESPKDIDRVSEIIVKTGTILLECPDITDIEINPLVVYDRGKGVKAVDVRIIIGG